MRAGSGGAGGGFETRAIHAGQPADPETGAVMVPIYQSSTFAQEGIGRHKGYEYARTGNPTRTALEQCLASLEGAAFGFCFASGMAAEDAVLRLLQPGDHLVLPTDAYGGTWRLVDKVHAPAGLRYDAADLTVPDNLAAAWRPETRMVWIETPSNPLLSVVDVAAVAAFAAERGAITVVDNTFATPYLQTPLALGADVVVHSTTKYLGGHSDVVGGFAGVSDGVLAERLGFLQNAAGAVPGPMDCFLTMRGVKTLGVRMDRHCANAAAVVEFLAGHPAVASVLWPGLPSHPGHDVAVRQMRHFGGMVSFTLHGGSAAAAGLVERTELITLAESLGGVESLIEVPALMTHLSVAGSTNEVDPGLVRLSVGIETVDDIVADLGRALQGLTGTAAH
ncbi:MAG TPA: cystathionine gamma-synthase [Acidimicrobiia bacterium]|nr:cystathionine gamma-synthase [Acidimicrobiia bacterium]HZQ77567.1 cystathionine gamma-synthase [Acidimicrobiia bacterium]